MKALQLGTLLHGLEYAHVPGHTQSPGSVVDGNQPVLRRADFSAQMHGQTLEFFSHKGSHASGLSHVCKASVSEATGM